MTAAVDLGRPFDGARGPARLRGVTWQVDDRTGEWVRHMLRVYSDGKPYWSKTYRLPDDALPFCLACLSSNVTLAGRTERGERWYCHECTVGEFEVLDVP